MNLYHFEEAVVPVIVERGMEYYEAGFVTDLRREGGGRFAAVVNGADMYEIAVQLDEEGEILSSYCDCPFKGPVCKHEVAVYYELIDRLKEDNFPEESGQRDLKTILENLSKEKLVDLLIGMAEADPVLHNELIFNYSVYDDEWHEVNRCRRLIDAIIEKYSGREGFISYKNVGDFTDELSSVLHRIRTLNEPMVSFEIAEMLLREGMNAFQYTDDSNGDIGYLVDETIKKISMIAHEVMECEEQTELLDRLIHLSKSDIFEGWDDYRIDLLGVCSVFAGNEEMRSTLLDELESMIEISSANDYGRYENERLHNLKYDIIETHGTAEEAREFLQENIKYPSFRKQLMKAELKVGNYENVLALATEGERFDKDYPGLVARWKKWRYKAYRQMQSLDGQMKVGRELLIEGEFPFYWELKDLVVDKNAFYEEMKQELAVKNNWVFVKLIEAENDVEAILSYVRENPSMIEHYLKYLLESHKDEAIRLFEFRVNAAAENSFNRNEYKEVCQLLRRFGKLAGQEAQLKLAGELERNYKNRPAFLDELGKL